MINCESLENSKESIYDQVYFSKFASLQCTINRLHYLLFLGISSKNQLS